MIDDPPVQRIAHRTLQLAPIRKAEGRKLVVELWGVWAGAPARHLAEWLAAVQVVVGNRRPTVGGLADARAVVHDDVTLHSHVCLLT